MRSQPWWASTAAGQEESHYISTVAVAVLLLASVGMFIALIQRIGLLQINRILVFTGDQGRQAIATLYPPMNSGVAVIGPEEFQLLPRAQTLVYEGAPRSIQAVDADALVSLARASGGVIEVLAAVGDTVLQSMPLLQVLGAHRLLDERQAEKRDRAGWRTYIRAGPEVRAPPPC